MVVVLVISTVLLALLECTVVSDTIRLEDVLGRKVDLPRNPSRVVSIAPSITESLAYIGVEEVIVGADSISITSWYKNVSNSLKERNVTDVGGYWWTSLRVEKIIELNPDLVLADAGAHRALLQVFESYNITVYYLHGGSARTVYDVYSDLQVLGLIFNKTAEMSKLIEEIDRELEEKRVLIEKHGYRGTRVLVVIDFYAGIWVAGRGTFIDDVISRLGLANVAETYYWSVASIEQVHKWNPDIVIVACYYATEDVVRESGLRALEKPIVILSPRETDILSRPGPLLLYAPGLIYDILSRNIPPRASDAATEPNITETRVAEQYTPRDVWVLEPVHLALVVSSAAVGLIVGYVLGYRLKRR